MQTRSSPSIQRLHSLAQDAGFSPNEVTQVPKPRLYTLLKSHGNYERLVRKHNRHSKRKSHSSKKGTNDGTESRSDSKTNEKRQRCLHNCDAVDPITFEALEGKNTVFQFTRPNGKVVQYNVKTLASYMLHTGNFCEPETRIAFSDDDLKRVDGMTSVIGLKIGSVLEAKRKPQQFMDMHFRRDALLGLEGCCGELVVEMLQVIEEESDFEEGEMRLLMSIFPLFGDLFRQIQAEDPEYAKQSLEHFTAFLNGPPNRRTESFDEFGFLPIVQSYLSQIGQIQSSSDSE
jgi:hypothetical protein